MPLKLEPQLEERLGISFEKIARFCQKWNIIELALFGSVLNDCFHSDSDIDILVRLDLNARQGLLTLAKIKHHMVNAAKRVVQFSKGVNKSNLATNEGSVARN